MLIHNFECKKTDKKNNWGGGGKFLPTYKYNTMGNIFVGYSKDYFCNFLPVASKKCHTQRYYRKKTEEDIHEHLPFNANDVTVWVT